MDERVHTCVRVTQPTRDVIGFVTSSTTSYLRRCSWGVGFVDVAACQELVADGHNGIPTKLRTVAGKRVVFALVRNPFAPHFRPVLLHLR